MPNIFWAHSKFKATRHSLLQEDLKVRTNLHQTTRNAQHSDAKIEIEKVKERDLISLASSSLEIHHIHVS